MLKRNLSGLLLASVVFVSGCATTGGRNYQADIDSLNAKVAALQGQLDEKDQKISSLQTQSNEQKTAREAAEAEKQALAGELEREKAKSHQAAAPASDLK